jgi:hypothetical protein
MVLVTPRPCAPLPRRSNSLRGAFLFLRCATHHSSLHSAELGLQLPPNHLDVAAHSHPARLTRPGGVFLLAGPQAFTRARNRTMWNEPRTTHATRAQWRELIVSNWRHPGSAKRSGDKQSPASIPPERAHHARPVPTFKVVAAVGGLGHGAGPPRDHCTAAAGGRLAGRVIGGLFLPEHHKSSRCWRQ